MQIITLTSDLGHKDHYVASIKAHILQQSPKSTIIDVSHQVTPFDVIQAARLLSYCFEDFPKGTVHLISVNDEPEINAPEHQQKVPAVLKYKGHFFVANDNGFFGVLLNGEEHEGFYRLNDVLSNPKNISSPTKSMLVPTACKLANGEKVEKLGYAFDRYNQALNLLAIPEENLIRGHIVYIDSFGNLITNIHRSLFDEYVKNQEFTIFVRNKEYYINSISDTYNAAPEGQTVAIFNSNDYLEIALNKGANAKNGGAEKLLGMKIDDIVRIEFSSRGSHKTIESLF